MNFNDLIELLMLSIIIPVFNRADFLAQLLNSCEFENEGSVEFVIVDDCSSENIEEVCRSFRGRGLEIQYHRFEKNRGAPTARNIGSDLAKNRMLQFVDSDDIVRPEGVLRLCERLRYSPEIEYAFGKVVVTDYKLRPLPTPTIGAPFNSDPSHLSGYHWHTMGAVYRKDSLKRVGGWNTSLAGSQDWEFQARVKAVTGVGRFLDTVVGYWRQHSYSRIGQETYKADYSASVVRAASLIAAHGSANGKLNARLRNRIAYRIIIHALQFGAFNDQDRKAWALNEFQKVHQSLPSRYLIYILAQTTTNIDRALLKTLNPTLLK